MASYDFISFSSDHDADLDLPIMLQPEDDEDSLHEMKVEPRESKEGEDTLNNRPGESKDDDTMKEVQDTMKEAQIQVPTHPIPSMQAAFAESMLEASGASTPTIPKYKTGGDAMSRRKILLDQKLTEETHASRWRQKPGQQYHELWKLMAQISFGIYLLLNGIAKDDEQVMAILQGHVDEVDEFLETTLEDFDLSQKDIEERLKFLKLPLENIIIFDAMLEDREFRLQIVTGNERIEHIITRTASAMNDALKDVQQGLDACKEFTIYLAEEQEDETWREERPEMDKVYDAMKGNVEGWYKAYVSLQTKGNHLGVALVQLGSIVAEMDKRAGEVSRKIRFSTSTGSSPTSPASAASPKATSAPSSPPRQSRQIRQSMAKGLPSDPNVITPAIRATLPAFQLVQDRERTPEPESQHELPESEPEPEFTLKPHTYSPSPSPAPPQTPLSPAPEIKEKPSRKRFSMKRKETPSEITLKPPPPNDFQNRQKRIDSVTTPPSRGFDSAYCSDIEYRSSPPVQPPHSATFPRSFPHGMMPSPRSDQQHFRPVKADPNSPLQRPWTAAPSQLGGRADRRGDSRLRERGNAPSAMGMSTMSDMTMMMENGKKVKKKRSAFGWLKKAFSLSDEERATFEERRKQPDPVVYYERRPQKQFLDGRRI